ncbi:Inositol 1 [Columba livia]|nr:Inositol 1 [Columba livia]
MIDQGHRQPGFAELSKEERLPDTFIGVVTPRGCSDLHWLAKVPQGSFASKNSREEKPFVCTLRNVQLKTNVRSSLNLCQIPLQATRKHALAPPTAKAIIPNKKSLYIYCEAMAAAIAFALAVLAVEHILKPEPQIDVATAERMRQREEYLRQEMDQLLREMEWRRSAEETALLSAMQHCLLLGIALVLVLLAVASWLIRRRKLAFENRREQDSSSRKEEDNEEVKDLNSTHNVSTPLLMQVLPDTCKALQHLVGDLLGVCRMLSKKTSMPQMHPAIGMDGVCESWGAHENNISYCLLVFLRPPPGHSFSLELDTMGELPPRHSSIRVVLDCVCSSEQLLGDSLCFLHHLDDNLLRDQSSYLLHTLCTSSCLDVEKIASWVQELVKTAWLFLPQSHHCQLTVLPSHQSCRFQLTSTSQMTIYTEMTFAVQQGSSIVYLSLE